MLREYDIEGGGASDLLGYENDDEDDEAFEEDDDDDIDGGDDDDDEDNGDDAEDYEATKRATRVRASRRAEGNRRAGGRKTQQAMVKQWNVSYNLFCSRQSKLAFFAGVDSYGAQETQSS